MANGMNSFMQLKSRNSTQTMTSRALIESYVFIDVAEVTKYNNGYVDCAIGVNKYTNVEVLIVGVNGFGVKFVPAVKDRVLLLAPRTPISDIEKCSPTFTMANYDMSGLKCIPITDSKTSQLFTVDKDKIALTFGSSSSNKNNITMNKDGFEYTDTNKNKIKLDNSGIAVTDTNSNTITLQNNNITASVNNGCSVEITDSHVLLTGKNGSVEVK